MATYRKFRATPEMDALNSPSLMKPGGGATPPQNGM
jgi:hypothetical protein